MLNYQRVNHPAIGVAIFMKTLQMAINCNRETVSLRTLKSATRPQDQS
jgi:hypothetical protein